MVNAWCIGETVIEASWEDLDFVPGSLGLSSIDFAASSELVTNIVDWCARANLTFCGQESQFWAVSCSLRNVGSQIFQLKVRIYVPSTPRCPECLARQAMRLSSGNRSLDTCSKVSKREHLASPLRKVYSMISLSCHDSSDSLGWDWRTFQPEVKITRTQVAIDNFVRNIVARPAKMHLQNPKCVRTVLWWRQPRALTRGRWNFRCIW